MRNSYPAIITGLAALTFLACGRTNGTDIPNRQNAPQAVVVKTAPPTPIQTKRIEVGGPTWDPQWDAVVERSLPAAMLSSRVPRDVRRFCPRFYQMDVADKREFWAYFFQALAGAEAGLNATANVRHTEPEVSVRDGVTGRLVRSEGLLQLTYEDEKRYGCDFNWQKDKTLSLHDSQKTILQPVLNLQCGIRILDRQIIQAHKPILSSTSYWSTLRPANPDYAIFRKQMTNPPAACARIARRSSHPAKLPHRSLAETRTSPD